MIEREILYVLGTLGYAFPNTKLPVDPQGMQGMARVWHSVLGELDDQYVQAAVQEWINTEQWFPAPAQIRQAAIRLQKGLPAPGVAWNDAQQAAASRDRSVYDRMHPVALNALRDIGGPSVITNATDLGRVREGYMKAYAERVGAVYLAPASMPVTYPGQSIMDGSRRAINARAEGQD